MISVARWSPWLSSLDQPVLPIGQSALVGKIGNPRADHRLRRARDPRPQAIAGRHLDRDAQIFAHGQLGEYLGDLKGAGDAAPHPARRQEPGNILAVEQDMARIRHKEPADHVEKGGLAGAVRADHRAQLSGLDRHRDAVDRDETAEPARDIVDFEQAHRAVFRPMMPSTPRGKNNTTRTKNRPMNDIQLAVWLDT